MLIWLALTLFAAGAHSQDITCGIYKKPASLSQSVPFYIDRFGNSFSEEELREIYLNSTAVQCANTGEFNLLIEPTAYQGNTYPTADQEAVICEVFSYLSGLIEAPGTGGLVNLQIVFDPSLAGSGNGGVGTPLFSQQCGIGHSIVQEQLNTQSPSLPTDFVHGYIRINPEYDWYTELGLIPPISNQQVDLYTVVLHEALHVLGFGSQVGASGNSLQGFYTLYDLHLTDVQGVAMVLPSAGTGDCCLEYAFNTTAFPDMPNPILTCGKVLYDVAQSPPVHGQYSFSPPLSNALAANILSHLSILCGSENYVMHASISAGATAPDGTPNIRRELTAAEVGIMCTLGYEIGTQCNAGCFVMVQDDGPFVLNEPVETLPYMWLTANDFDAEGNYLIEFDFDCGNIGNMAFDPNNQTGELTITLNNTPFGEYELCYTIFSCDGKLCQSGTVRVIVAEEVDPSVCLGDDCNLASYGDFELFPNGGGVYYPTFAEPWNSQVIGIPESNSDNSVNVFSDGENQFLHFVRCDNCSIENVLVPLCETIPNNCGITVEFDACSDNQGNGSQPVMLGVWGFSQLPNPMALSEQTVCNGVLMDNSGNVVGTCLGEVVLTQCNIIVLPTGVTTQPVDFVHYSITLPNGFPFPITHLWFFDYPSYTGIIEILLDNVSVTTDCQNKITVTPTILEACIGGQAVIELEVCLDGELDILADIAITPGLQGIPGISLSANNPDFPNGVATIEGLLPGDCVTLTLFLDVSPAFQLGTQITFPLDLGVEGACVEDPSGQTVTLTLEACENLLCDCPPGSTVIGSPGAETLLSDLVANSTLPASPQFNQPLNITVRGTLVMDANVVTGTQSGTYIFPPLSDICMDAGAEIRIPPKNTLSIFDSHVRGCEKRWKSITVMHDATLNLVGDGLGLVEDGQYAVHPRNKSMVNITSTRFNKNYEALHFNDPLGEFFLQPFFGNTVQCTQALLPHYDPQAPDDGPWSFAGIHTIGQDFLSIGVAGQALNRFDGLRNGIITQNANLTLRNSRFSNIQRLDYTTAGHGVMASGNGHNFLQDGTCYGNKTVFFNNCSIGIFLKGMNATVRNNQMDAVATGVLVRESPNRRIDICGNAINCTVHGISLWFNDPAQRIRVGDNAIHVSPPVPDIRAAAIFVRENGAAQPDARIEFHEDIGILNAGAGISLNGCNGYDVEQNFITAAQWPGSGLGYAGITLWNSPGNSLSCNRVNGDYESNAFGSTAGPFGIRARASTGVAYDCNDLRDTYLGVQFDMGCGDTRLRTTGLLNHRYGLHYTVTGITGTQPTDLANGLLHGNRWNGAWGGASAVGARHENPLPNFINLSRYIVRSIAAPWGPQNPSAASPNWFTSQNRPEIACGSTCDVWLTEDPPTNELDERIAAGQANPGVHAEPMQWMLERDLYRKLYASPGLVVPLSLLDTFYNDKSATTIGRFTAVEAATHALFELDNSTAGQLQYHFGQITGQMGYVVLIDSLLQTTSGQDSLDLLVRREHALDSIESLSLLNSALSKTVLQARSAAANGIIAQNYAIAVADIWEENEKAVNHIFLSTIAKGIQPNGTQLNLLRGIAAQCPYEGGTAVFRARAYLDGMVEEHYDDGTACGLDGGQQALMLPPAGGQSNNTGIQMYPNPAKGLVSIRMEDALESDAVLSVYNLYGQLASRHYLQEGDASFSFTIETLPQGIYLVRIQAGNKAIFSTKLVIAR